MKEYLAPEKGPELPDGTIMPKFFLVEDSLEMIDPALVESKQPFKGEQEIDSYVWTDTKKKEMPIDEYNHAIDSWRYSATYDAGLTKLKPRYAGAWGRQYDKRRG